MLKVKDNIDLKELEKFGLIKDDELSDDRDGIVYSVKSTYQKLCVGEDRELYLYEGAFNSNTMILKCDVLYDLIKNELVEKVEELEC